MRVTEGRTVLYRVTNKFKDANEFIFNIRKPSENDSLISATTNIYEDLVGGVSGSERSRWETQERTNSTNISNISNILIKCLTPFRRITLSSYQKKDESVKEVSHAGTKPDTLIL